LSSDDEEEDSDTDFGLDYEYDENSSLLSHDDPFRPTSSHQHNGGYSDVGRRADGLANDVKGRHR